MTFSIRAAVESDIDQMQQIEVDAGRRFVDVGLDSIAAAPPGAADHLYGHVSAGTAWVAMDDPSDLAVGYAMSSVVDGLGHLDQVSTMVSAGGRGIGSALVEAVCEWAVGLNLAAVTLTTFRDVPFNAGFYERRGFELMSVEAVGAELASIRSAETADGLDISPRVAMIRSLAPD